MISFSSPRTWSPKYFVRSVHGQVPWGIASRAFQVGRKKITMISLLEVQEGQVSQDRPCQQHRIQYMCPQSAPSLKSLSWDSNSNLVSQSWLGWNYGAVSPTHGWTAALISPGCPSCHLRMPFPITCRAFTGISQHELGLSIRMGLCVSLFLPSPLVGSRVRSNVIYLIERTTNLESS